MGPQPPQVGAVMWERTVVRSGASLEGGVDRAREQYEVRGITFGLDSRVLRLKRPVFFHPPPHPEEIYQVNRSVCVRHSFLFFDIPGTEQEGELEDFSVVAQVVWCNPNLEIPYEMPMVEEW